jgi:hypothetical protein
MHEVKNQFESEEKLVGALRRLARESSQDASPEVAAGLAAAFRRHHRRRRTRNAAIAVLAIACLASAALLWTKPHAAAAPTIAKQPPSPAAVPIAPAGTPLASVRAASQEMTRHVVNPNAPPSHRRQAEARRSAAFLPLPAYDPMVAKDDLQIIRVEMPIQDLRLVGAPVGADVPNRPVRADFVVGHDGTPYAVRLVQ